MSARATLLLSRSDVAALLSIPDCIDAVEERGGGTFFSFNA